jgi:hypothetical protein
MSRQSTGLAIQATATNLARRESNSCSMPWPPCRLADTSVAPAGVRNSITFKPWVQTVSTALVYRFNWSGPIAARY